MPTALITGANRGMGAAYVEHYLANGWRVFAACRTTDAFSTRRNDGLSAVELDVADEDSVASLPERIDGGSLDLLINNAGVSGEQPLGSWTVAELERQFRVNAIGPALLTQALAPRLARGAKVANISSGMASLSANPDLAGGLDAYAASKAALNMLTARLAMKLRERDVTVVAINPGWVRTEMGGADAPTPIAVAVERVAGVIDRLTSEDSGRFLNDDGTPYPW